MSDIIYKAVYSDTHLAHFKYIDKWKSKAGNWVYKYREDLEDLKNDLRKKLAEHHRDLIQKPKKEGSTESNGWHDVGSDASLSEKRKYEESMKGNDKTRVRRVKDYSNKNNPTVTAESIKILLSNAMFLEKFEIIMKQ